MPSLLNALGLDDVQSLTFTDNAAPQRVHRPPADRIPAIAAELSRLRDVGDKMKKIKVVRRHMITITGTRGSGQLVVYNRSIVQSPIDTSVIEDTNQLIKLLGLAK
ncbi:MAG: hypothetical protein AAB263_08495 [Planctomycetota bacterium]